MKQTKITLNEYNYNKWLDYQFKLNNYILTKPILKLSLKQFWKDIIINLSNDHFIFIQFKIKLSNGLFRSISHVKNMNNKDFKELLDSFNLFWDIKSDEYHISKLDSIIFTYKIIGLDSEITKTKF